MEAQHNMSATSIRNKYHVAINTIGYMLRGAPNSPAYTRSVVPSQVNRLAISDLSYSDFAGTGLFYLAQTDWSAGIKSESLWRDDAKYYYSSNIDTFTKQGELTVLTNPSLDEDFTEEIYCGINATVNSVTASFVGSYKNASDHIQIYQYNGSTWSDIAGTTFGANNNLVSQLVSHKNHLYVMTVGVATTNVVASWDGSSWADESAAIDTAMGWNPVASRSACKIGSVLYVGLDDYLNNNCGIASTVDNGANWVEKVDLGYTGQLIAMAGYLGKLYYLVYNSTNQAELRVFDPVASTDIAIRLFAGSFANYGVGDKILKEFNGKLIITTPSKIYEYDGSDLSLIFEKDPKKDAIGSQATAYLTKGCIEKDGRLYWGNLVYDGENFFNYKKPLGDNATDFLYPLFVDASDVIWYKDQDTETKVYKDPTATYKPTLVKNFIVFNEMAPVVSIDKLLYSVTAIFNKLISGDEIKLEYSIDNMSTWTNAGTISYTNDGGSIISREFIIPGSILFKKIWWKMSMANSNGTSTPVFLDLIMSYRPMTNYKNQWQMRLNMSDGVKLLNKQNDDREGSDMNSQLWNEKLIKQQVKFQDIDYVECTLKTSMTKTQTSALVTSIKKLPDHGRIRAISGSVAEEMYYTSAKADRILGITRAARGTVARAYLSGQVLDNGYSVYVEDITTSLNFTDEEKTESVAQVLLIEA